MGDYDYGDEDEDEPDEEEDEEACPFDSTIYCARMHRNSFAHLKDADVKAYKSAIFKVPIFRKAGK